MKIAEEIHLSYTKIAQRFALVKGIKCECNKIIKKDGTFTVTLEIIIENRISDYDYGLVFSTNAQRSSHLGRDLKESVIGEIFLMSDLSYGDGEMIADTKEFKYLVEDVPAQEIITETVLKFIVEAQTNLVPALFDRYGIHV